jgi:hypothetical protein
LLATCIVLARPRGNPGLAVAIIDDGRHDRSTKANYRRDTQNADGSALHRNFPIVVSCLIGKSG